MYDIFLINFTFKRNYRVQSSMLLKRKLLSSVILNVITMYIDFILDVELS